MIELRKLCGKHRTIPTSYKLEGVNKEGEYAQRISKATEIWKGRYKDEVVALKILRLPRDDPYIQRVKSRLCKEVVLMKHWLEHKNILPFYGVSTTVSDFCLVFPWYSNGNIMEYLKENPDINQFKLLSGAASGLSFLHEKSMVHGSLRPSHILVDDSSTARLATAGRSSIVATPGTSTAGHIQSVVDGDDNDYRYIEPEILLPDELYAGNVDRILATKEGDVYGMAMVVYEALTGNAPYSGWNDTAVLEKLRVGEFPQEPSGIDDMVWEFLQRCWSRDPAKRPSTSQVCDAFSKFSLLPKFIPTPEGKPATELPGRVKLLFKSIKVPSDRSRQQPFSVKLKYGNKEYTTSPTKLLDTSGGHTWNGPESWSFETDRRYHGQTISLELILRAGVFKKDKIYATGEFSLTNNINKQADVRLEVSDGGGPAVLKVLLTAM